jgi:HD-GYP domain-containing protein (c-di-GMP phosphodiesterase class II)
VERPRIVLCGMVPPLENRQWEGHTNLRIGRLDNLEVAIDHPSLSRRHAEVYATERGWMIHDLGSTNGTFVNGVRVGRTEAKLHLHDVLQCGELNLRVAVLEEGRSRIKTSGSIVRVQAAVQRSWEQAQELPEHPGLLQGKQLLTRLRAGYALNRIDSLDELLQSILNDTVPVLRAQRGAIVLADETSGTLYLRAVLKSEHLDASGPAFSRTLAERCLASGESWLCRDVSADDELSNDQGLSAATMSSIVCAVLRSPRQRLGVLHLDRGPRQPPFSQEDFLLADAVAASVSVAIETVQLVQKQRDLFLQTVTALAQAIELRDESTGNHTLRVTVYALLLADELGVSSADRRRLEIATPLHDIGKIAIDDAILRKPGKLTAEEYRRMKEHVSKGSAILETIPDLAPMLTIIRYHHERWDGKGYPDGLAGEAIPLLARIVSVADAFDAMTSTRHYRTAMTPEKAFAELSAKAGSQFDPTCVAAFLSVRPRVEQLLAEECSFEELLRSTPGTLSKNQLRRQL